VRLRKAIAADLARIEEIMRHSMANLGAHFYDERQVESAVLYIAVVDPMLVEDGTYFVVEDDGHTNTFNGAPASAGALGGNPPAKAGAPFATGSCAGRERDLARVAEGRVRGEYPIVACGGWSKRAKLFTGTGSSDARPLDPASEPARVRAMFVLPSHARRGIGRMILDACEDAARKAAFRKVELMATLPGEPLYAACGYAVTERVEITLPDGVRLPCAKMEKSL
jgi:GNAT superfamily N-acetyltransferase